MEILALLLVVVLLASSNVITVYCSAIDSKPLFVFRSVGSPGYLSRGDEPRTVVVKAQFSVDGVTDPSLSFLDDRVLVSHFDDCRAAYRDQEVNWVAMVAMVVVVLLGVSSLAGLCIYRHHRAANEDQMDLVGMTVSLRKNIFRT